MNSGTADDNELPSEFLVRLQEIYGPRARDVVASMQSEKRPCIWLNPLVGEAAHTFAALVDLGVALEPLGWMPETYLSHARDREGLVRSAVFTQGAIYLQNASSLLASRMLAPQPGEEVLDLAAAPGGKTIQLAAMMENRGRLAAVESVKGRFFRMRANLERAGVCNAVTYLMDGRSVGRKTPGRFQRVLLDAPCSSEARFRVTDPGSYGHWSLKKVRECARKQRGLIASALEALVSGGRLLYCTCAFSPEENELVVQHALERFEGSVAVLPIEVPIPNVSPGLAEWRGTALDARLAKAVRVIPDEAFDGFFMCLLEKR
ncbi:MAG: RsmB/NOP family class I SAM-dependent RNA methyltransferase [Gammaproteobacteria bacterium]|jgi:16S rRNA C967 or C1407 C5-methylase (RsmB/RsmF family)